VVKARNIETETEEVAIKIIRKNDMMKRNGLKEIAILKDISEKDPQNKYNCIKLLSHFEHQGHLCLLFEPMLINLREILQHYGKDQDINIQAVQLYAKKLVTALKHMKRCSILHADIKLDNILVDEGKAICKLADFGSASFVSENSITPYLVSRFYRAPEIILGHRYDYPIDMWSLGCCIYELYTGRILFPGKSNNEMMKLIMEVKGAVPKKMLRASMFRGQHFDTNFDFLLSEKDSVTFQELVKVVTVHKPMVDLRAKLLNSSAKDEFKNHTKVLQLHDFLEKCLILNPEKRLNPEDALKHPFLHD